MVISWRAAIKEYCVVQRVWLGMLWVLLSLTFQLVLAVFLGRCERYDVLRLHAGVSVQFLY